MAFSLFSAQTLVVCLLLAATMIPDDVGADDRRRRRRRRRRRSKGDIEGKNLIITIERTDDLTRFYDALVAADLADNLDDDNLDVTFTVFVPDNNAMKAVSLPDDPYYVMIYHMTARLLSAKDLKDGLEIQAFQGDTLTIKVNNKGKTLVNGAEITRTIETSHGYIHVLDQVLLPPTNEPVDRPDIS